MLICWFVKGQYSDDNCSLLNKKSVLQTKYRPLFIKKQTKFENVIAKSLKLKIVVLCQIRLLSLYLASTQWILTQSTQWRVHTLKSILIMASLKLVEASPKILTFWINTDQLQTIFNHFSEKVCITDQNYLYRPNCHHWE